MSISIAPPSAINIAADGWKLALRAVASLPILFASGLLLLVFWEIGASQFGFGSVQTANASIACVLAALPGQIVDTLIFASVAIAVHRFVVLGEIVDRLVWQLPKSYTKFAVWLIALQVLITFPSSVLNAFALSGLLWLLGVSAIYLVISCVVSLRSMLLFPAIAIGVPETTWQDAWNESRGHAWQFFWALICTCLPVMIALLVATLVIGGTTGFQAFFTGWGRFLDLFTTVSSLLASAVLAATASRFFQLYGNSSAGTTNPLGPSVVAS